MVDEGWINSAIPWHHNGITTAYMGVEVLLLEGSPKPEWAGGAGGMVAPTGQSAGRQPGKSPTTKP